MTDFFSIYFLGVHLWILLLLLFSIVVGIIVILYINREKIKEKYIKWRFPEKTIKVVIHFKGAMFKTYWRLVPSDDAFVIDNKMYLFSDKAILKDNDFYLRDKKEKFLTAHVEGKDYIIDKERLRTEKGRHYPEIHFLFGVPEAVDYDTIDKTMIKFTGTQLNTYNENDLFKKLLTLDDEKNMMMILMIIGVLNALMSIFIILKITGVLDK